MNLVRNKIFALLMSFLTLISSTGFAVDVHICKDEIKSFSIFGSAAVCEMEIVGDTELPPCHQKKLKKKNCIHSNETVVQKKSCCHNETLSYNVAANQNLEKSKSSLENSPFFLTFCSRAVSPLISISERDYDAFICSPPLILEDFSVLYQVFRI